jgi:hypothetical protein
VRDGISFAARCDSNKLKLERLSNCSMIKSVESRGSFGEVKFKAKHG